jgi:hypothetical protein
MRTYIKSIFTVAVLAVALTGCAKFGDFGDINKSPNNASDPNTGMFFAASALQVRNTIMTSNSYDPWMQLWTGYIAEAMNNQFGSLTSTSTFSTSTYYLSIMGQMNKIIALNQDEATKDASYVKAFGSTENQIALAMTYKAFFMMMATDIVGPLPYSEAFKGDSEDIWEPKFDSVQDIYTALDNELNTAYAMFNVNGTLSSNYDILYHGDVAKWKKFNAAVRMMLAIKLSDVDPATGKSRFAKAYSDGSMTKVEDGLHYTFSTQSSAWFYGIGNKNLTAANKRFGPNKFFIEALKEYKDPRLFSYFTLDGYLGKREGDPKDFDAYHGITFGQPTNNPVIEDASKACSVADRYCEALATYGVITTARILLLEAEAAQRGWISADAKTLYEAGIKASFEFEEVDGADEYIAAHPLPSDGAEAIKEIVMQRWFAGFLKNGVETWSDWRRTNVPKLPLTEYQAISAAGSTYPVRLAYGTDMDSNPDQRDAAVATLLGGSNTPWTRLWWDVADND